MPIAAAPSVTERFAMPSHDPLISRVQTTMIEGSRDPVIRELAMSLTRNTDWRAQSSQAIALLRWVQSRIRYAEDPVGTDYIQQPSYTLDNRTGDCVAQTVLLGALLLARGIPATAMYQDPDGLGIGHVLLYVEPSDGPPLPLDPIDYSKPAAYTPGGSLFIARGIGRAVTLEDASMLQAKQRPRRVGWGVGALRPVRAIGQTTADADAEDEAKAETDWFKVGLGGTLGALGLMLQKEQGLDPNKTPSIYGGGSGVRPPSPPAEATVLGMSPMVLGGIALVLFLVWQAARRRNNRKRAA